MIHESEELKDISIQNKSNESMNSLTLERDLYIGWIAVLWINREREREMNMGIPMLFIFETLIL